MVELLLDSLGAHGSSPPKEGIEASLAIDRPHPCVGSMLWRIHGSNNQQTTLTFLAIIFEASREYEGNGILCYRKDNF